VTPEVAGSSPVRSATLLKPRILRGFFYSALSACLFCSFVKCPRVPIILTHSVFDVLTTFPFLAEIWVFPYIKLSQFCVILRWKDDKTGKETLFINRGHKSSI